MSPTCMLGLVKKQDSVSLLMVTPSRRVVAAGPPGPHLVVNALRRRPGGLGVDSEGEGAEDPTPRKPPVATFEDIPVSVSTQLVPSVGHSLLCGCAELHVPSARRLATG